MAVINKDVTVQPPTYRHSEAARQNTLAGEQADLSAMVSGGRISKNEILRGVYSECYSAQDDGAERLHKDSTSMPAWLGNKKSQFVLPNWLILNELQLIFFNYRCRGRTLQCGQTSSLCGISHIGSCEITPLCLPVYIEFLDSIEESKTANFKKPCRLGLIPPCFFKGTDEPLPFHLLEPRTFLLFGVEKVRGPFQ